MALQLAPYLMMNGNANEAIEFYKKIFDAKVVFKQTFGEMPKNPEYPFPEEAKNLISHAMIQIGETNMMFSDNFPGSSSVAGDMLTICLASGNKGKSAKIFEQLSDKGIVKMPLQETFFSPAYGIVTDKFGITFQISTNGKK